MPGAHTELLIENPKKRGRSGVPDRPQGTDHGGGAGRKEGRRKAAQIVPEVEPAEGCLTCGKCDQLDPTKIQFADSVGE